VDLLGVGELFVVGRAAEAASAESLGTPLFSSHE
jgi:hypothetical protein